MYVLCILIQICDHKMRIRFLDARYPGSSHNSLIWNVSHAKQILQTRYDANDRNSWLLGKYLNVYLSVIY